MSERDDLRQALRESTLFSSFDAEQFERICADVFPVKYKRGQMIFNQNEAAAAFFIVVEGWVKVFRITAGGEEAVIGVFTRSESFAEIAALARKGYPASAEAVTDVRLAAVPIESLARSIVRDPQYALTMLASMSLQVRRLVDEIEQMKALSGIQRVAEFLIMQCSVKEGACAVRLPYEKALIASKLGMKAESLSRVFQRLRRHGIVIRGDMVVVNEVSALRNIVEMDRGSAVSE